MEILAGFNVKLGEIRAQCLVIRDLIGRVRGLSDDWNFQRVLDHWESANEKFLRKYPEGYVASPDQLDDVVRSSVDMNTEECKDRERSSYRGSVHVSEYDFFMQQAKYTVRATKFPGVIALEDQSPLKLGDSVMRFNILSPRRANQTQPLDQEHLFSLSSQSKGRRTLKADEFIARQKQDMEQSRT